MITLVEAEKPEEVRGDRVGCGVALLLPERGVEVVALTVDCALPHVEGLCGALQLQEPPCQLQVRVGDCAGGVFSRDKLVADPAWPRQPPQDRLMGGPSPSGAHLVAWPPDAPSTRARGVVVAVRYRPQGDHLGQSDGARLQILQQPTKIV